MKQLPRFIFCCFIFFVTSQGFAVTTNNSFANRTVVVGTNITVQGNNSGATTEPGEDTSGNIFSSVWFSWTAPKNGLVYFAGETAVPGFNMSVRAYRGTAVGALTAVQSDRLDGGVVITNGDRIEFQVATVGSGGARGPFNLMIWIYEAAPLSINDAFADAIEIVAPHFVSWGGIYGATNEPGEPLPPGTTQTLWWRLAPAEGAVLAVTTWAQFGLTMTLYEGTNLSGLTEVVRHSSNRYLVEGGHNYVLQMASGFTPIGDFTLDAGFYAETNDMFAGSKVVTGTNITYVGNVSQATFETGEPDAGALNTLWLTWQAPATGRAHFGPDHWSHPLAVYTGPAVDQLQAVPKIGIANGVYDFYADEGTVYHFQMGGQEPEVNFALQLDVFGPPANDNFGAATVLGGQFFNSTAAAPLSDATAELGEPAHLGGTPFKSVWWKWTAPSAGSAKFSTDKSLAPGIILAAYKGSSVEALTLITKGSNVTFSVHGGDTCHIAAAIPTNALGDVMLRGGITFPSSGPYLVPGNLLLEPSWEGTAVLGAQHWHWSGQLGGYVNEPGGTDGTTWPVVATGSQIWQDFGPTIPGKDYMVRFAMRGGDGGPVKVLWDTNEIGVATVVGGHWNWFEFPALAQGATSRVTFTNLGYNAQMDAFSVVSLFDPPQIINPPGSLSVREGGTAGFAVGALGTPPLSYHWSFSNAPYATLNSPTLVLNPVGLNQAGDYQVIVSNAYGVATSAVVTLTVQPAADLVIVWQPYGDSVGVGGYYSFGVVAAGIAPFSYQWLKDSGELPGATNRTLTFAAVDYPDAGTYSVRVTNTAGIVHSLGAKLTVTAAAVNGGAAIHLNNRVSGSVNAPVFDIDGVTPLGTTNYLAQLYAGPSLAMLRPAGQPTSFPSAFGAGYFKSKMVIVPTLTGGVPAVVEVRVWDSNLGSSYEEARALGGKFGKSGVFTVATAPLPALGGPLIGLQSFNLQAGLPQFAAGRIALTEIRPDAMVWAHQGEVGCRYLIEESTGGFEWLPYLVITNSTSTINFTNSASTNGGPVFYRSRILD